MAQFYTILTSIGQAKLANAVALGNTIALTHLAVGDGGGTLPTPDSDRTSLVNEVRRAPINLADVDPDNPNWIVVEQVLPPDVGGWTIREIGVFDAAGDLIAYGNYPETFKPTLDQGSGRTQTIRMVLQVSDTAAVTLRVDPSVVLATRKYADQQAQAVAQAAAQALQEHQDGRNHPLATDTERGMVVRASQEQVNTGEDNEKFVSPKTLKSWATQWVKQATETVAGMLKVAAQDQVDAGENDQSAVTPKKLRWGVSYSLSSNGYISLPSWLGGLIIQWGYYLQSANGDVQNLPIAFPNVHILTIATDVSSSLNTYPIGSGALTLTTFRTYSSNTNPGSFQALSIGY